MQRIYPITEEGCRGHCGKPVLILTVDGTEILGILTRVEGGKLYLNEQGTDGHRDRSSTSRRKARIRGDKKTKANPKPAQTAAVGPYLGVYPAPYSEPYPYGGFGPALALDLFLIAALFVLV